MKRIVLYIILLFPVIAYAVTPLHGTKTISSTGSGSNNYLTIADAITDLYANGVDDEVTFLLVDPLYVGQFNLNGIIPGASLTNTVTFSSQTKDPNDVEIIHTAGGSGDNYIININQAQYVSFNAITFTAGVSSYGRIVYSENPKGNIVFYGNIFNGLSGAGTNIDKAIVYCVADNATENLDFYDFQNNQFNEGSYGLYLRCNNINSSHGLKIKNNTFSTNTTNIYLVYFTAFTIEKNTSTKSGSTFAYQITNSIDNFRIRYNKISSLNNTGKGIKLQSCNIPANAKASIDNNFIQASDEGISIFASRLIDVINNSVNIEHPSLGADISTNALTIDPFSSGIMVQANLLINKRGGYTFNAKPSNISTSNHNNLYTTGINIARWNSTNYTSLSSFVAASSTNGNSLDEPVTFVSISDLHIQSTQIYLSGGSVLGYLYDIDNYEHLGFIGASEPKLNGTYTIGTSGYYSSITQAVDKLYGWSHIFGSVTYNILDGIYNEKVDLNGAILGSSSSRIITFQSNSGNATNVEITHTASSSSSNYVVRVIEAEYIKFKNLTLTAGGTDYAKVVSLLGVNGNLEFYGNVMNGYEITSSGTNEQTIIDCSISSKLNNSIFENNVINNGYKGIYLSLESSNPRTSNLKITGNDIISKSTCISIKQTDSVKMASNTCTNQSLHAIYLAACFNGFVVEKNITNSNLGIFLSGCGGTSSLHGTVRNNFFSCTGEYGIDSWAPSYIDFYNNTVNLWGLTNQFSFTLRIPNGTNTTIVNNMFNNYKGGKAIKWVGGTITECNYNNLYTNGSILVQHGSDGSSTDYATLAAWQASPEGFDASSYNEEVTFVSSTDLHIASSPVHLDGTTIASITTDIDGDTRNNPPFIGADEYVAPLSGVYTIGVGGDYVTITEAINSLYLGGVSGAVIFKLLNGTYTEQINLDGTITGSSATNTVTFESNSGNASDVVVTHTASGTVDNYVVRINETEYIKFKNLKLTALGDDFARVVYMENVTGNLEFYGNVMNGYKITSGGSSENQSIVYCGSTNKLNNTTFENNVINNGYHGMYFLLNFSTPKTTNLLIKDNNISTQSDCIIVYHSIAPKIESNICSNNIGFAISLNTSNDNLIVEKNKTVGANGISIITCNGSASGNGIIKNNFVSSSNFGIFIGNSKYINIFSNTVRNTGSGFFATALRIQESNNNVNYLKVLNNILYCTDGGGALYWESGTISECNYNNLYTTSSTLVKHGSSNYATLAAWQAATALYPEPFATNSYSEEVTFVSATDLHIVSTPVPLNGIPIASITTDIDGDTRGTPPFIGADEPNGTYVSIKVILEGSYNTPEMNAILTLPIASPYNSETVTSIPIISGNEVVDWVLVELRDENNSSIVLESQSAFVLKDGSVVDLDGISPVHFTQPSGINYFVAVKHRNHLSVMSASAVGL